MESSYLKKMIEELREEIGHERVDVNIKETIFNKEKDELIIIAPDRSDKSVIIGKGGWVVGRLKEALGIGRVHVEAYTDLILKKYRIKLSLDKIESLIRGEYSQTNSRFSGIFYKKGWIKSQNLTL